MKTTLQNIAVPIFTLAAVTAMFLAPSRVRSEDVNGRQTNFALIIGVNKSLAEGRLPLRFADDDALLTRQLFTQLAPPENIVLLASPDKETAPLSHGFPMALPTRQGVETAMAKLNEKMRRSRQSGMRPILYLFYTGHGDVKNNEGYITLNDGRFTRSDLLALLHDSTAVRNHVVIDACKSYFMVFKRGAGGDRRPLSGRFVREDASLPQNTGFFLSTSSGADSHEWEAFQGGIFSHEMRSALRGGADVNSDKEITYEEAAAFIWRANEAIPVYRFRPEFFVRPPGDAEAASSVLADLNSAKGDWLHIGYERPEHQYLEDGLGRRLLDIHPAKGKTVALLIPERRPLFIRFPNTGREISLPHGTAIDIRDQVVRPWTASPRGAEHEAFRRLFTLPYDSRTIAAYRRFRQSTAQVDVPRRRDRLRWARRSIGIGAVMLGATGGAMTGLAVSNHRSVDPETTGSKRQKVNHRIDAFNTAAVSCYGVAGAALAAYLVLRFLPQRATVIGIAPLPSSGLSIKGRF